MLNLDVCKMLLIFMLYMNIPAIVRSIYDQSIVPHIAFFQCVMDSANMCIQVPPVYESQNMNRSNLPSIVAQHWKLTILSWRTINEQYFMEENIHVHHRWKGASRWVLITPILRNVLKWLYWDLERWMSSMGCPKYEKWCICIILTMVLNNIDNLVCKQIIYITWTRPWSI